MTRTQEIISLLREGTTKIKQQVLLNELENLIKGVDPREGLLPELDRPIIFMDLETTGTDVLRSMIVEISMLKIHPDGKEELKTKRVNPGIPIPAEATEVHGITDEMVKDEPTFVALSKGIYSFMDGCDIAGFNSNRFDVPLLFNLFQRFGIKWDWRSIRLIDVRNIYIQKEERTLTAAVKFYTGRDHTEAHSAEADIRATKDVFLKQLAIYPDLAEKNMDQIALFSNYDREIIDIDGFFGKDDHGNIIFNVGKHKGKVASMERGYLTWMMDKGDFSADTKEVAKKIFLGWI